MQSRYVPILSGLLALLFYAGAERDARAQEELNVICAQRSSGVLGEQSDCIDATITYGETTIHAGRFKYRNLNTRQGEWNLTDGVSIETDDAELAADTAVIVLEDGEIVSFALLGSPSRISHVSGDDDFRISAESASILYDVPSGSLELNGNGRGNVRFVYGDSVFETCELSYNLNTRSYNSDCGFRSTVPQAEGETDGAAGQRNGP